jgi:mRNA interferase RelE/StbE
MPYTIELTPAVEKTLLKLARKDRALMVRIDRALLSLSGNPTPPNSKQLFGEVANLYRFRLGDYRIICQVDGDKLVILVVRLGTGKTFIVT